MSLELYLAYVVACVVLAMVPGPNVTLLIANGLRHGTRAALICLLGTQVGLAIVIAIVGAGLTTMMATMGYWFDWVRLAGAAYLIWIGIGMLRAKGGLGVEEAAAPPRGGFFLQGMVVLLSNPKVLVFFGAFIPQFVDMKGDHFAQVALLGATFMVVAGITDAIYAVLAGRARKFLSARRERLMSRISGAFMIGGGLWLAFTRAR
jgi:threonine/homoserine/homoserine lactone efflux protein